MAVETSAPAGAGELSDRVGAAGAVADARGSGKGAAGGATTSVLPSATIALLAALGALVVAGYWEALEALVNRWISDPDYSHGFLVPLFSGALVLRAFGELRGRPPRDRLGLVAGAVLVLLGIAAHWVTVLVPSVVLSGWSLVMVLSGVMTLLFGGWRGRRLIAATAFLVFMVPLPAALYAGLAVPLQWLATKVAVGLVELCGAPAIAEGNLIRLPGQTLHVAAACSGLRQLLAFLALATALALVMPRPWWVRALLLLSAGPIAIAANVARVTLNGLAAWRGFDASTGILHSVEGLILVGAGAGALLLELRLFDWLAATGPGTVTNGCQPTAVRRPALPASADVPVGRTMFALVLLGLGLGGRELLARSWLDEASPPAAPLEQRLERFPDRLGPWSGHDDPVNAQMIRDIKVDAWLQRVYVHPTGERVALWISGSRRSLDQYHYPTVCMQGAGWTEDRSRRTRIALLDEAASPPVSALRMRFERGGERQTVHYWYYLVGEGASDRLLRQFHGWSRALLRGRRNASVTVEVFSQSARPRTELLDDFARRTARAMTYVLPVGASSACDLGADF